MSSGNSSLSNPLPPIYLTENRVFLHLPEEAEDSYANAVFSIVNFSDCCLYRCIINAVTLRNKRSEITA